RGEVGSGPPHKIIQRRAEPRPPLEQLGLREAGRGAPEARPPPVLVAAEGEQLRLEAVVVAPEDRLAPADLLDEARDLGERAGGARRRAPRRAARVAPPRSPSGAGASARRPRHR